jgi:uncharacterized DUF497 family protein
MDFEWDEDNLGHIRRHGVEAHECEEAIADPHAEPLGAAAPYEIILGLTAAGRLLWVLFEDRGGYTRVGTARSANTHEERIYWSAR